MHDAIESERLGIPAVAVVTDRFQRSAEVVAGVHGVRDYPFTMIEHPIANNDDATLRAKAETAVQEIVRLLTERASAH